MTEHPRVLYADRDASSADAVVDALAAAGYDVSTVTSVAGVRETAPDVDWVVTAGALDDGDAVDACEAAGDCPVVVYAGRDGAFASRVLGAGAVEYVHAPAGPGALVDRLTDADRPWHDRPGSGTDPDHYAQVLGVLADGVYALDPDGYCTMVNDRLCELTGHDRSKLLGAHASVWLDEDPLERAEAAIRDLLATPEREVAVVETTGPDGDRHFEIRLTLLRGPDGAFEGTVGSLRDVTERREREAELEVYEQMLNTVPDTVYALDEEGKLVAANEAARERTGFAEGEFVGEHVEATMREEDLERGQELITDLLARGERQGTIEMRQLTVDGEELPVENHLALRMEDGEFRGTVGVLRDISERKRRERTLRALHDATRDLLAADTEAAVAEAVTSAVTDVLGFPVTGVRLHDDETGRLSVVAASDGGQDLLEECPRGDEATAERAYRTGETAVDDLSGAGDCGPVRHVMAVPIEGYGAFSIGSTDADGFDTADRQYAELLAGNAAVVLDRVAHERDLERQNARLSEFASIVSHDLRNPLNVAAGQLDLYRRDGDAEHLDQVERAHDRMGGLIEDLLALARYGDDVTPEPVDVETLARQAWATVETGDATLTVAEGGRLLADREETVRLFENLFRNAVEHGSTGSRPTADDSVEHGGEDVAVRVGTCPGGFYVADDGPGIPESERERATTAGYTTGEGTGLGLAIVDRVAEAHGWSLSIDESEAGGAQFAFTGVER
ncbi:MAG: PAS domain S-box protein [Haloarculaceae archaeon]